MRVSNSENSSEDEAEAIAASLAEIMLLWRSPLFQERFNRSVGAAFDSTEGWIVWLLGQRGSLRPADLVALLGINAPGITKAVGRLESSGMIMKSRHPGDARSVLIDLTPLGADSSERLARAATGLTIGTLSGIPASERRSAATALAAMSANLQATAQRLLED